MDNLFLNEHRCKCGKLLLKGIFFDSTLEIKCKKCGEINKIGNIKLVNDDSNYLLIINSEGNIVNISDSTCKILGYSSEELIGKNFTLINSTVPKEIGKKFFGTESVLSESNHLKLDTFHQTKSGKKIPVTIFLKSYRPTNKEKYFLVSVKLKNIENYNKIINEDVPLFLESGCDFWFELDKNGVGEYVSQSVEKLFGFIPNAVIGKNYFDYLPTETRAKEKKMFDHYCATEQPYRIQQDWGIDSKGGKVFYELFFTPKFSDSSQFVGYCVLGWIIKKP